VSLSQSGTWSANTATLTPVSYVPAGPRAGVRAAADRPCRSSSNAKPDADTDAGNGRTGPCEYPAGRACSEHAENHLDSGSDRGVDTPGGSGFR